MLLHQSSCFRQENCEHKSRAHFAFITGNSRNGKNGLMGFARFTTLSVCLLSPSEDSNTNLESKLACYQITTHFLCHTVSFTDTGVTHVSKHNLGLCVTKLQSFFCLPFRIENLFFTSSLYLQTYPIKTNRYYLILFIIHKTINIFL